MLAAFKEVVNFIARCTDLKPSEILSRDFKGKKAIHKKDFGPHFKSLVQKFSKQIPSKLDSKALDLQHLINISSFLQEVVDFSVRILKGSKDGLDLYGESYPLLLSSLQEAVDNLKTKQKSTYPSFQALKNYIGIGSSAIEAATENIKGKSKKWKKSTGRKARISTNIKEVEIGKIKLPKGKSYSDHPYHTYMPVESVEVISDEAGSSIFLNDFLSEKDKELFYYKIPTPEKIQEEIKQDEVEIEYPISGKTCTIPMSSEHQLSSFELIMDTEEADQEFPVIAERNKCGPLILSLPRAAKKVRAHIKNSAQELWSEKEIERINKILPKPKISIPDQDFKYLAKLKESSKTLDEFVTGVLQFLRGREYYHNRDQQLADTIDISESKFFEVTYNLGLGNCETLNVHLVMLLRLFDVPAFLIAGPTPYEDKFLNPPTHGAVLVPSTSGTLVYDLTIGSCQLKKIVCDKIPKSEWRALRKIIKRGSSKEIEESCKNFRQKLIEASPNQGQYYKDKKLSGKTNSGRGHMFKDKSSREGFEADKSICLRHCRHYSRKVKEILASSKKPERFHRAFEILKTNYSSKFNPKTAYWHNSLSSEECESLGITAGIQILNELLKDLKRAKLKKKKELLASYLLELYKNPLNIPEANHGNVSKHDLDSHLFVNYIAGDKFYETFTAAIHSSSVKRSAEIYKKALNKFQIKIIESAKFFSSLSTKQSKDSKTPFLAVEKLKKTFQYYLEVMEIGVKYFESKNALDRSIIESTAITAMAHLSFETLVYENMENDPCYNPTANAETAFNIINQLLAKSEATYASVVLSLCIETIPDLPIKRLFVKFYNNKKVLPTPKNFEKELDKEIYLRCDTENFYDLLLVVGKVKILRKYGIEIKSSRFALTPYVFPNKDFSLLKYNYPSPENPASSLICRLSPKKLEENMWYLQTLEKLGYVDMSNLKKHWPKHDEAKIARKFFNELDFVDLPGEGPFLGKVKVDKDTQKTLLIMGYLDFITTPEVVLLDKLDKSTVPGLIERITAKHIDSSLMAAAKSLAPRDYLEAIKRFNNLGQKNTLKEDIVIDSIWILKQTISPMNFYFACRWLDWMLYKKCLNSPLIKSKESSCDSVEQVFLDTSTSETKKSQLFPEDLERQMSNLSSTILDKLPKDWLKREDKEVEEILAKIGFKDLELPPYGKISPKAAIARLLLKALEDSLESKIIDNLTEILLSPQKLHFMSTKTSSHQASLQLRSPWAKLLITDFQIDPSYEVAYAQAIFNLVRNKLEKSKPARRINYPGFAITSSGSLAPGRGFEFDEYKSYQTGDDIQSIDWKASARTGDNRLLITRRVDFEAKPHIFILDLDTIYNYWGGCDSYDPEKIMPGVLVDSLGKIASKESDGHPVQMIFQFRGANIYTISNSAFSRIGPRPLVPKGVNKPLVNQILPKGQSLASLEVIQGITKFGLRVGEVRLTERDWQISIEKIPSFLQNPQEITIPKNARVEVIASRERLKQTKAELKLLSALTKSRSGVFLVSEKDQRDFV